MSTVKKIKMQSSTKVLHKGMKREKTTLSSSSDSEKNQDPVHVFCRLKPLREDDDLCCVKLMSPTVLSLSSPFQNRVLMKDIQYIFKHIFTACSDQKKVFQYVAYPLLQELLSGKNGLLFTYGVTGSGKTYTLTGDQNDLGIMPRCINTLFNTIGQYQAKKFIIKSDKMNGFEIQSENETSEAQNIKYKASIRSLKIHKKAGGEGRQSYVNDGIIINGINETNLYGVFISYIEVYNNTVYDLLDESIGKALQKI